MSTQLIQNYVFNAAAGTITFTDYASISLERIAIVYNVTDGVPLFNFASASLRGSVATNVLTIIDVDTTSMSNGDDLAIHYFRLPTDPDTDGAVAVDLTNVTGTDGSTGPTEALSVAGTDASGNLQEIRTDTDGNIQADVLSSALPTGASTEAKQDTIINHVDGLETNTTDIPSVIGSDGAAGPAKAVSVAGTDGSGNLQELRTDTDGHLQIDALSSALPTGASTEAKQDIIINHVDGLETNSADIPNVIGTDGSTGPSKAISVGGTDGSGNLQELRTDTDGNLQVDILSGSVTVVPSASGGNSIHRTLSAASTNSTNIKGSAGQLYGFIFTNTATTPRYVKLYDKATAPTIGSDTPIMTLMIPGNSSGSGMVASDFSNGISFVSGIGFGITTGVADSDTAAVGANEVIVHLIYA